jgi:acyl-CoA thioesterase FadM
MDEALTCTTYLSDVRRSSSVRHHLIYRDAALIARARVLVVLVNPETRRLVQTPPEMRRDFAGQMAAMP